MRQKHKLLLNLITKNQVLIPLTSLQRSLIRKKTFLRFGIKAIEVEISASKELEINEIVISKNIVDELSIPLHSQYEIIQNNTELLIGPYIGILACKSQEILHGLVQNLSNYLYDYEDIGGAILAFSEEGIDMENNLVTGYAYNPLKKTWEPGIFSYPASIFRRCGLKKILRNHLQSVLGDKVFNNYIINKWEMHEWLSSNPTIRPHLPETIRYTKSSDVLWFLEHYSPVYVKPILGSQGKGIIKGSKLDTGYEFKFNKDGQDYELAFESEKEVQTFLKENKVDGRFLIQQGINVLKKEDSMIDFRLVLVKNYSGNWVDMGLIARYGVTGRIVSNVSSGGYATMGEEVFRDICNMSEQDIFQLRKKISEIAILTAESLDKTGILCGNLGFDLAVDRDYNIWIIELNNQDPNHTIAIDAGNKQLFYETKKMNMLYAKNLAGF